MFSNIWISCHHVQDCHMSVTYPHVSHELLPWLGCHSVDEHECPQFLQGLSQSTHNIHQQLTRTDPLIHCYSNLEIELILPTIQILPMQVNLKKSNWYQHADLIKSERL